MPAPRLAAGLLLLALATGSPWATGCAGPASTAPADPGTPHDAPAPGAAGLSAPGDAPASVTTARSELAGLRPAAPRPMTGFSARAFAPLAPRPDGCTTPQEVLRRTGHHVVLEADGCRARSGSWYSGYDGVTLTDPARVAVDDVVPLAEAWRSGADTWTAPQRAAFGNDLTGAQLVVASGTSLRAKGAPGRWTPPNPAVRCAYAEDYVHVKARYRLTTTDPEKAALTRLLTPCR